MISVVTDSSGQSSILVYPDDELKIEKDDQGIVKISGSNEAFEALLWAIKDFVNEDNDD